MDMGASQKDRLPQMLQSASEMIRNRDERRQMAFTLTNGVVVEGFVRWFDAEVIHIVQADRTEVSLFKHAILHYTVR